MRILAAGGTVDTLGTWWGGGEGFDDCILAAFFFSIRNILLLTYYRLCLRCTILIQNFLDICP